MVHFTGTYYKIDITDGVITILDTSDNLLATMGYYAQYGVVANWTSPHPEAEGTTIHVRDASMLSVDDEVQFINQQLNEVIYHTATISDISNVDTNDDLITFTPALPEDFAIVDTNAQLAHGVILKRIDNTIESFTSPSVATSAITGGTKVTLTAETAVADIEINIYCLTNSHKINIEVITTYSSTVNVFRERLVWSFENSVSGVFTKNRKYISSDFDSEYWLGNQGCVFGTGTTSILSYNNNNISSLELDTTADELVINLDDDRDHRFRHMVDPGVSHYNGIFEEENAALYNNTETRTNEFNFYIGLDLDFSNLPRLMVNPMGYLATFCWDSHADGSDLDQMLAAFYGSANHVIGQEPTKGAVAHNFLISHGIFISWTDNEDIKAILDDLHNRGYEINLHSIPINYNDSSEEIANKKAKAYPLMSNDYNVKSRTDHYYSNVIDNFCCDGLDDTKDAYMKSLWDTYGVRYHSSAMSEDCNPDDMDVLAGGYQSRRSPLYYKHPTRYSDYRVSAQAYRSLIVGGWNNWESNFSSSKIDTLISNWGVYVGHVYYSLNTLMENMEEVEGVLTIKDSFDTLLQDIKSNMNDGELNITTKGAIMEYWEKTEKVNTEIVKNGVIEITNSNGDTINNFSIAIDDDIDNYIVENIGIINNVKSVGDSNILYFDLPPGTTKLTKYKDISVGQSSSGFINNIQQTFENLSEISGAAIDDITDALTGSDLISAINDNITAINGEGNAVSVGAASVGMQGSGLLSLINGFYRDYATNN